MSPLGRTPPNTDVDTSAPPPTMPTTAAAIVEVTTTPTSSLPNRQSQQPIRGFTRREAAKRARQDFVDEDDDSPLMEELARIRSMVSALDSSMKLMRAELSVVKDMVAKNSNNISTNQSAAVPPPAIRPRQPHKPHEPVQLPVTSYADAARAESNEWITVKSKKKPVVIVPKSASKPDATRATLKKLINPVDVKMCGVRNLKNGGVVVDCPSSAERAALLTKAKDKLGDAFNVSIPVKRQPCVRVYGLTENIDDDVLLSSLRSQNPDEFPENSVVKIVHRFEVKAKSRFGFKLEVDVATLERLRSTRRLYVGWDACWVNEDFNIRRCFKCWGFNHVSSNCKLPNYRCSKCGGDHKQSDCSSTIESCALCCEMVVKTKVAIATDHAASSAECPCYLRKLELARRNTDYGTD